MSIEIRNAQQSNQTELCYRAGKGDNLRWRRNLSTNMTLEIDTDPNTGQTISLRMLNRRASEDGQTSDMPTGTLEDTEEYFEDDSINLTTGNSFRSAYNDSGVSSNLQSPTVSNSDSSMEYAASTPKKETFATKNLKPTHRVLYKFCSRHSDEIDLEIGDAVHVLKEHDDQWSEGVNLRTNNRGIFPSALVTDVDYNEFSIVEPCSLIGENELKLPELLNFRIKRERFCLNFLGSIEVCFAKGDQVLDEAIDRITQGNGHNLTTPAPSNIPYRCILEVSDIGVRMMSETRPNKVQSLINRYNTQCDARKLSTGAKAEQQQQHPHDYFFSLLQLTYCGYQVREEQNYFAFITRHPSGQSRHACHVFQAPDTGEDIAETVGQSFQRFYNQFVDVIVPSHDH